MTMTELEKTRKRLHFRAWHRGTKESDLLLGRFADQNLASMSLEDLADFEQILDRIDPELIDWLTGREPVPANLRTPVLDRLLAFEPAIKPAG
jgi:antitoxin CptB